VLRLLQTLAWLACVAFSAIPPFWLAIHPFARFWRARRRNPYPLLVLLWLGLWTAPVALITRRWRQVQIYNLPKAWLPAAALFALGIYIYRRAGAGFSWSQLGGVPEIRESSGPQSPLAMTGIRAHVRHPIYLAHLLEMLAWSLGSGLVVCFVLTAISIVTGAWMIVLEDRELGGRFGEDYRRYKDNVPAILLRRTPYNPNQRAKAES
jgi:protein-S-isoprenylcysteine O-methyltransferase Ste14